MDLFTQGLLGGVLAQTVARRDEQCLAAFIGFCSGLLADADVLIRSSEDPLLVLEYHRHFTHSLFFVPFGALIAAVLLWPLLHRHIRFSRLYLFALLGFSLSGFLDACTSYGTYWLWPIVDERLAFSVIAIIDPVFSLALLLALIFAVRLRNRMPVFIGLVFCGVYLLVGLWQSQRVIETSRQLAQQRNHAIEAQVVKPTIGNLLLWRSLYIADGQIVVDAVRAGLAERKVYPGDRIELLNTQNDFSELPVESVLYHDIQRFVHWSDGFVFYDKEQQLLGDARYSLLPSSLAPLWALAISPDQPEQHANYVVFRKASQNQRHQFMAMLLGKPVSVSEQPKDL